ncbi:MAG: D-sedoheptulose 7-phosphate isomerase [Rhizobiales bacterium]|nr:D-sedoheptulose 7-phosphate isomerase [Hyphomicrobiales bacterium]
MTAAAGSAELGRSLEAAAAICIDSLQSGGKVLFAGNGGSAGDAQHLAGEFLCRFNFDRRPLPGIALTTDSSTLTAIANDYAFDQVFARQLEALGRPGDVFIGISTSGRSKNIIAALDVARRQGVRCIGLTGATGGDMATLCDTVIKVPSDKTPLIQQVHITVGHILCDLIEQELCGNA